MAVKVSVVVPVHNGERTLRLCLGSILRQKYPSYELIVVNNNSIDGTKEILDLFSKKFRNIKIVFEERNSPGAARNAGILAAEGKYILMTDVDCIVPDNWIDEMVKLLEKRKANIAMGFESPAFSNYWTLKIQAATERYFDSLREGKYIKHLDTKNLGFNGSLLKKNLFNPDLKRAEDLDLFLRVGKYEKVLFAPKIKVNHFHRSSLAQTARTYFLSGYWFSKVEMIYGKEYVKGLTARRAENGFSKFVSGLRKSVGDVLFGLVMALSWYSGVLLFHFIGSRS